MLGYMTEKEAAEEGFTHHGSYYGLPIWCALEEDGLGVRMITKWWPVMALFYLFFAIEQFINYYSDNAPSIRFEFKEPIVITFR